MKYEFIEAHRHEFRVSRMCAALHVSRSGFYEWRERPESQRAQADRALLPAIHRVHRESRQAYGAKKTWIRLNQTGITCGKHRVARLRRREGIEARRKQRFRVTVEHHYSAPPAPNLLQQQFRVLRPNRVWVGDMTFIRTRQGWLHLAILLDLYSRRVVGWSMSDRPDLAVVKGALEMALEHRRPPPGLIHHTDQGQIYLARAYRERLAAHGAHLSMSAKGNAYDNAVAESFFSNLKNELVHHCDFATRDQARAAIFEYIEVFYNRQRMHQTLAYVSPVDFEQMNAVS